MSGQLFTCYFLEEGILHTVAWQESLSQPEELDAFRTQALTLLEKAANFHGINEASTKMELIRPLFDFLGWNHYLPQQGSDHSQDIPDNLLFGDAKSKDNAVNKPAARYPDALAVAESKRFNRPFDATTSTFTVITVQTPPAFSATSPSSAATMKLPSATKTLNANSSPSRVPLPPANIGPTIQSIESRAI